MRNSIFRVVVILSGMAIAPAAFSDAGAGASSSAVGPRSGGAIDDVEQVIAAGRALRVFSIHGESTAKGRLVLDLKPGPVATKAIRVYSQPSGTLLLYAAASEFAGSEAGSDYEKQNVSDAVAMAISEDFTTAEIRTVTAARPALDNRIQVFVYGNWPDGPVEDRLIADGLVGPGNSFGFTTSVEENAPPEDPLHCCETQSCGGQFCESCPGPAFTCCMIPPCCWIQCGHVLCDC